MISTKQLIEELQLNERLAMGLIDTIPAERFTEQPMGIRNHPAWILGHLRVSENTVYGLLTGGKSVCSEEEIAKFKVGSEPIADASMYPEKTELVEGYLEMHRLLIGALEDALPEVFTKKMDVERLISRFPTYGMFLVHVLAGHEGYHLGQLSTWRRVAGLASE
ncbi:DinB superfamily protein [Poriferisphaera corsica]|uniref:DinB superfamily protein n=1 Tax=Poriferisphaera corsica TaxID=2528020 RepID=A0A517YR78_9BACT|nr:DinB family protein [Poriferisphaera corsica]QDU32714.1 DinB superfamily protein [Poriferisphaera corsica]